MNQTSDPSLLAPSQDSADQNSKVSEVSGASSPDCAAIPKAKKERAYSEVITRHMKDVAQEARVPKTVALRVARALLAKIVERLTAEDWPDDGRLILSNLGRFEWRHWAPRHGYNPRARKGIIIPAKKKLRFVVAKQFGESQPLKPRRHSRKKVGHAESQD